MKTMTADEFNAITKSAETGIYEYPTADYSQIRNFPAGSRFGARSRFGADSSFGADSRFGARSRFGADSSFGDWSSFGEKSSFGAGASFGKGSRFGARSSFGDWSSFGEKSSFGAGASFGEGCCFENEGKANEGYPLLSFGGFGSANRTTYAFNLESGIWIRCGCFKGTLERFEEQVKKTHGDNVHAEEYLAMAQLIRVKWNKTK